eukprot:TRINITY_DN5308_c0_g1_i1.p1 TRINITY_DN5308_c0_g1~~TRINITY_DN5308_c0_g1_i1.p1  ORF type:complete len:675 (-),score=125.07 TRINITY_DN5308_c0_g1_i1:208-2193(-)
MASDGGECTTSPVQASSGTAAVIGQASDVAAANLALAAAETEATPGDSGKMPVAEDRPFCDGDTPQEKVDHVAKDTAGCTDAVASNNGDANGSEQTNKPENVAEEEDELLIKRVASAWAEHVSTQDTLAEADRLTLSAAYRKWAKDPELGILKGNNTPPYTEVWLVLQGQRNKNMKEADAAKQQHERGKPPDGGLASTADAGDESDLHSEAGSLRLLDETLNMIREEGRAEPFNASLVSDRMRQRQSSWDVQRTPFKRLNGLLKRAEEEGWVSLTKHKDDVRVKLVRPVVTLNGKRDSPCASREREVETGPLEGGSGTTVVEVAEAQTFPSATAASRPSEDEHDPLAELAAEVDEVYRKPVAAGKPNLVARVASYAATCRATRPLPAEDDRLRHSLDRRATERLVHGGERAVHGGERAVHGGERTRGGEPSRGGEPTRPLATHQAGLAGGNQNQEGLRLLDIALKDMCREGLPRELPVPSSFLADRFRRQFPRFRADRQKFADVLHAAERTGLLRLSRDRWRGSGGDNLAITWVKYKYRVNAPPAARRRSPSRSRRRGRRTEACRSRSRDRGRDRGGGGGGFGRGRRRARSCSESEDDATSSSSYYSDSEDYSDESESSSERVTRKRPAPSGKSKATDCRTSRRVGEVSRRRSRSVRRRRR